MATTRSKQNGNDDQVNFFNTGREIILKRKEQLSPDSEQAEKDNIIKEASTKKDSGQTQVKRLEFTYSDEKGAFVAVFL